MTIPLCISESRVGDIEKPNEKDKLTSNQVSIQYLYVCFYVGA